MFFFLLKQMTIDKCSNIFFLSFFKPIYFTYANNDDKTYQYPYVNIFLLLFQPPQEAPNSSSSQKEETKEKRPCIPTLPSCCALSEWTSNLRSFCPGSTHSRWRKILSQVWLVGFVLIYRYLMVFSRLLGLVFFFLLFPYFV